MKSLHTSLNTAYSGRKPIQFHVILHTFSSSLPILLFLTSHPATSTFLQADTQSSTLLCSRCPNHLNLLRLTISAKLCIPKRLYKSTFHTALSILQRHSAHPSHHHLLSVLTRLGRFSAFIAQVSVPYVNTLWNKLCISVLLCDMMHHQLSG